MDNHALDLKRFARRLRLARAIRYLCRLTLAGATLATGCALLDLFGVYDFDFASIGVVIAFCALAGAVYGFVLKAPEEALAKSIERRAGLQDRLSSAMTGRDSAFLQDLKTDAASKLASTSERDVFPIRFARAQAGMVFSVALPFVILLVSYHHLLLNPAARQEREDVKAQAATVQHVLSSLTKSPEEAARDADLVKKLQRLQHDLERGKLDRQAAKEKADQISQQADRMMRDENQKTQLSLDDAQSAMDKAKAEQELNSQPADMEKSNAGLNGKDLTGHESEQQLKELAAKAVSPEKLSELEKQIAALQQQLKNSQLSQAQREALQKELNKLQKQQQQFKLSKEAQEVLRRLQNDPEYQKLMKEMAKLRQNAKQMDQGESPSLSKEQIEQMEREMEELAKQLKDPEAMKAYIKALKEALEHAKEAGDMKQVAMLMGMMGMPMGGAPSTTPGPPDGAHLNMSDKEEAGRGKTFQTGVQGEQNPNGQPAPYIEQRGMAALTGPSSIPLLRGVGASRRRAEEAIAKQRIPKEQQARVKKYFEALEGKA